MINIWRSLLSAAATIVLTLFFAWMATAVNASESIDPTFLSFMTGIVSVCVLVGGGALTVFLFLCEVNE